MATQTAQGVIARPKAAPGQWREAELSLVQDLGA